jgi:hypothetical protein
MDINQLRTTLLHDVKMRIHSMTSVTPNTVRQLADWASVLNMLEHYKHEFWPEHIEEHQTHDNNSYLNAHTKHNPY